MADPQVVAAGLGAMNLFGTLLLGWIVVIAAAIYVTNPGEGEYVNYSTIPLAFVGSLGFAALAATFYRVLQAVVAGFQQVPASVQQLQSLVTGFVVLTGAVFILVVTKPLADSVSPAFERRYPDERRAGFAAYGAALTAEFALVAGPTLFLVNVMP